MLIQQEKSKVNNLFNFLKQYNNLKNPTITDIDNQEWYKWLDNIQEHENIKNNIFMKDEGADTILTVSKPQFTECPQPSEKLNKWLYRGWNKYDEEVMIKKV